MAGDGTDLTVTGALGVTTPDTTWTRPCACGPGDVIGIDPRQVVPAGSGQRRFHGPRPGGHRVRQPRSDRGCSRRPRPMRRAACGPGWSSCASRKECGGSPAGGGPLPVLIAAPAKPDDLPIWPSPGPGRMRRWSCGTTRCPMKQRAQSRRHAARGVGVAPCARRLVAFTDYIACVVPTFEVGRLSGLNLPLPTPTSRAGVGQRTAAAASVALPVYYHWSFRSAERAKTSRPSSIGWRHAICSAVSASGRWTSAGRVLRSARSGGASGRVALEPHGGHGARGLGHSGRRGVAAGTAEHRQRRRSACAGWRRRPTRCGFLDPCPLARRAPPGRA